MKTRLFTTAIFSMISFELFAGILDGRWRCETNRSEIEIVYTREGIKVRQANRDAWDNFSEYTTNGYRDRYGNCYTMRGDVLEYCSADRRNIFNFSRINNSNWDRSYNDYNDRDYRDRDRTDRDWNGRDRNWRDNEWRDRDNWSKYYRIYEGKWHNHTTGTHIHVDLSRRSLRIKFHGEKWYEVVERSRGLFVDRRGNEFYFRGEGIEYRSNGGDLMMRFYHDDRCGHRDDYREEYWR